MKAKEFLEYEYGITLTEEKALIHPQMLIKAMEEYAQMVVKNLHKHPVIRQVCTIGGECKVRGENNECKGTAYCGYKKHTFL